MAVYADVTPRKRRVSRNRQLSGNNIRSGVTPRKRRVSRNNRSGAFVSNDQVTPRKRRVSRNFNTHKEMIIIHGHASQEACE